MSTTDILTAFATQLDTLALTPDLPVIWPGIQGEPPSSGMWLEARFFPNEPDDLTWGNNSQQDTLGFFQVSVFYRPGQHSQIAASEIADTIIDLFPKGFTVDACRVRKTPWQASAVDLSDKSFIPITIPYRGIVSISGYSGVVSAPATHTTTDILTAFLERLDVLGLSPALPVAWPGIPHKPPSSGMWIEARFSNSEPDDLVWDTESQQYLGGFFEVSIYWRPNQNSQVAASEIADAIIDHFPKGLPVNAVRVLKAPWQNPAIDLPGKSFIRVVVPFSGIISSSVNTTYYVVNNGVYVVSSGAQVIST